MTTMTTSPRPPIKVLVVDDSAVARDLLSHILNSDAGIQVIGTACNAKEAMDSLRRNKPDIISMDINMPVLNGFEATRIIMETNPVPIVIVTGIDLNELDMSFHAIEAGALTVLHKPHGIGHPRHTTDVDELITAIKLMSEIKVVKRWARGEKGTSVRQTETPESALPPQAIKVVAVGASTGGPPVLERILAQMPETFSLPILIVQHMAPGFIAGLAEWLGRKSPLPVHVALNGGVVRPGHVYLAPDGAQMKVEASGKLLCTGDAPENGLRPSVSYLFRSIADVFGKEAVGVLLTGMGRDGASDLMRMKEKGAVTIAQDEESSAVFGMPGEAVRINAAQYVLPPDRIASILAGFGTPKTRTS